MSTIDTLIEAIKLLKPISYEYNKPGKTSGQRVGHPYTVYRAHNDSGKVNINTHIVQVSGVSDSTDKQPLPSFRTHTLDWLSNVEILHDEPVFTPNHPDYNPNSDMYIDVFAKV